MAEHHSKATVAATYSCKPCGKPTMHTVFDGRRGSCQECIKRLDAEAAKPKSAPAATQTSLF